MLDISNIIYTLSLAKIHKFVRNENIIIFGLIIDDFIKIIKEFYVTERRKRKNNS
jgi:hypothetical protein